MKLNLNIRNKLSVQNVVFYFMAFVAAYFLKRHYSTADVDDLMWILQPTAVVVEWMTGLDFFMESGTGYVNHSTMVIIAKACAGVNFFIISFCMSSFEILPHIRVVKFKCISMIGIATGMFIITVIVNAIRISVSIYLLTHPVNIGWLTQSRLHRIEGIAVYFICLWLIFILIQKIRNHRERIHP